MTFQIFILIIRWLCGCFFSHFSCGWSECFSLVMSFNKLLCGCLAFKGLISFYVSCSLFFRFVHVIWYLGIGCLGITSMNTRFTDESSEFITRLMWSHDTHDWAVVQHRGEENVWRNMLYFLRQSKTQITHLPFEENSSCNSFWRWLNQSQEHMFVFRPTVTSCMDPFLCPFRKITKYSRNAKCVRYWI